MKEIVTLIGEIVKQILGLFEAFTPEQDTTFDDIETQVRSVMLEIGRRIVETIVKVRGTGYAGKIIRTPSGEVATYHEDRSRTIKTLMGSGDHVGPSSHAGFFVRLRWLLPFVSMA